MNILDLREGVSSATHAAAFFLSVPAVAALWRKAAGDRNRQISFLIYGSGLMACFGASALCHASAAAGYVSTRLVLIDHIAIFLLIAGTYTPIARHLLRPPWQRWALGWAWAGASLGIGLNVLHGPLPAWEATPMYLTMGWGGLICYAGMRPSWSHRSLSLVPIGGVLYTVGATFHLSRWPMAWAGMMGPHEIFHLLVIAGAAAHYWFVYRNVATPSAPIPAPVRVRSPRRAPALNKLPT